MHHDLLDGSLVKENKGFFYMGKIRSCGQFLYLDVLVNLYILQYKSALKH